MVNCKSNIFSIVIFAQLLRHFMILNDVEFKCMLQLQFILQSKENKLKQMVLGRSATSSILICMLNAIVAMLSVL